MAGFIKADKEHLLEEAYKVDALLDFSAEVEQLDNLIKRIPVSALIGYIGRFGSGKSTTIYQLQRQYEEKPDNKWFEFDAWKYPERKDLWEGLVLDIADQLGQRKGVHQQITASGSGHEMVGAVAQIAGSLGILPGLSLVADKLSFLFKQQPIERVFEIQELLISMLSAVEEKNLFFVVEDLDRSGDAGRYFLETLRQFVKNNLPDKRVIVIVPIGSDVYENHTTGHRDSFKKVLDYALYFSPALVSYQAYSDAILDPAAFPANFQESPAVARASIWKEHMETWFQVAAQQFTIRELKAVIREANLFFQELQDEGHSPDPRIVLWLSLLNHAYGGPTNGRWLRRINPQNQVPHDAPLFHWLRLVAQNQTQDQYKRAGWREAGVHWVAGAENSIPVMREVLRGEPGFRYELSTFYLKPYGYRV